MTKPKAILWDWDNTLFDSWDIIHLGWNAVSEEFSLPILSLEEVKTFAHRSCRDIFPSLFLEESDRAANIFYKTVRANQRMTLMPGAQEILQFLHDQNILMGVVSNKEGNILRHEIETCGFSHFFSVIFGSGDVSHDKPAPDGIQQALDEIHLNPTDIVYIGDTPVDVEAAFKAGCTSIVVHTKASCEPRQPHYFCSDLIELKKLMEDIFFKKTT